MYRDGVEVRTEDGINFLLTHCALGDAISSLPAICWARKMHSLDIRMTVWAATHMLPLFEHLIGGVGLRFKPLDEFKIVQQAGDPEFAGSCVINSVHRNHVTRNRFDMVDFAYATLLDRQPDGPHEKNYPYWAPLGSPAEFIKGDDPYVIVPVGSTNEASTFRAEVLGPILEWLLQEDYLPVLTGAHNTHVHAIEKGKPKLLVVTDEVAKLPADLLALCLDLRNRTDLMQMRDLCGHAAAVVGVDGGTLHLAGTTEVPIVYGTTRVAPRHRGIVRHDQVNWNLRHVEPRDLDCRGCQSNWTLMFGHDFRHCAYEDFACTKQLHPDDFTNALHELGL